MHMHAAFHPVSCWFQCSLVRMPSYLCIEHISVVTLRVRYRKRSEANPGCPSVDGTSTLIRSLDSPVHIPPSRREQREGAVRHLCSDSRVSKQFHAPFAVKAHPRVGLVVRGEGHFYEGSFRDNDRPVCLQRTYM